MTLWSRPVAEWTRPYLHFWCLSALQARKWFPELVLFTDDRGEDMLIRRLGLPFDRVERLPKEAEALPLSLRFFAKSYAYRTLCRQGQPWLHLDSDVFLWRQPPERILNAAVFAQSPYLRGEPEHRQLREKMTMPERRKNQFPGYNCGIFGGHDCKLIGEFVADGFEVVKNNLSALAQAQAQIASSTVEECFMADYFEKIECLFADKFTLQSARAYTHLTGLKHDDSMLTRIELRLLVDYPEWRQKALDIYYEDDPVFG